MPDAVAPAATSILARLRSDLLYCGERCYTIRPKVGEPHVIRWNKAQRYLHAKLEEQKARTGKVRAIILKGRQQGVSTYVQARFYHRVSFSFGVQAFILSHKDDASTNIFAMTRRFYDNSPEEIQPHYDLMSTSQIRFDLLDSGYQVSTAGSAGVGRSFTIHLFHGSEMGYWKNDKDHESGINQAVPDAPGTEVILESTANGVGNSYHKTWQDAEAGLTDFQPIFIPWFWDDGYQSDVPDDFELSPEDVEYKDAHGLIMRQMAWRAKKIAEFHGDKAKFQQEYPATPQEAFEESGVESYISSSAVSRARRAKDVEPYGAKIMTIDVARFGEDRTVFTLRQGRVIHPQIVHTKKSTMQVAGLADRQIDEWQPDKVFIDVVGIGAGVVDRLLETREEGDELIVGVNGGEKADDAEQFYNKRAEMYFKAKAWLENVPAKLPDDDALHADATACGHSYDSNSRLQIERKEHVKKRGKRSPDLWDGVVLSFAQNVKPRRRDKASSSAGSVGSTGPGGWMI